MRKPLVIELFAGRFGWGDANGLPSRRIGSQSEARKRMTAEISEIPFELAAHIARVFRP